MDDQGPDRLARLMVVAAMGVGVYAFAWITDIPGSGLFLVAASLAGFAAVLVAPGWTGFAVLIASITISAVVDGLVGGYVGLLWLVVVALLVPATLGALAGYPVHRVRSVGLRAAIRDWRTLAAVAGAVTLVALIAFLSSDLAANPP